MQPARITSASTSPWSACTVPFGPDNGVVELQVPASRVGHQEYGGKQAPDWRRIGANCKPNSWDTPIRHQSLHGLTTRILYITLLPNSTILTSQFFLVTPCITCSRCQQRAQRTTWWRITPTFALSLLSDAINIARTCFLYCWFCPLCSAIRLGTTLSWTPLIVGPLLSLTCLMILPATPI